MMDLRFQVEKMIGKNRRSGILTQYKNTGQIRRLCNLIQQKYGLENIRNLKTKHIAGIFQELRDSGKSPSTIASYATAARTVAAAIGKQNIVPRSNVELGASRKGERLKPVDVNIQKISEVTTLLHGKGAWLGLAAEMRVAFGLRAKESLLSHVVNAERLIVEGSKGGRPRSIPIRTQAQRDLLKRISAFIEASGQASLIPSHLSLKQGLKAQANALEALGANKENRAHAHAARHAYAQELARLGLTKKQIAEELGHGRREVVAHYVEKQ